ncbi:MAG: DUF4160 domain-containing protein [Spirochaetes bacterium]|nr:MAG: DUF4160 domain-containing protein [Spirochaetota bacterium]RKX73872.1 MAG: DUF4160 domain-containing protein [Spirochaetota bacterium]RKX90341.1 MAG: DUF4160 domain-containing protein [Spirochaetota bacterium]RKX98099.1 MAG: DUF4160 domain-containing protein [Spirochaetota bacterium]
MPTVFQIDGYRFFFYSSDIAEPIHIHVEKGGATAKFWISPLRLQKSRGFSNPEINRIIKHVEKNHNLIVRCWNEFFND